MLQIKLKVDPSLTKLVQEAVEVTILAILIVLLVLVIWWMVPR